MPEALRAGDRGHQGGRAHDQVPLHDPQLPQPGRRLAVRGAPPARSSRSAASTTSWCSRTTPTACSASTTSRSGRCAPTRPSGVIYLGSFSKTFAPGFRVGWALAPHAVREKLVLAQESATLCPPAFSPDGGLGVPHRSTTGRARSRTFREMYRERRDAMVRGARRPDARRLHVERPDRRLLRVADACRRASTPRRCCRGRSPRGWPTCPGTAFYADGFGSSVDAAVVLLPDARSGSARAYAGWPACWRPRSSCARRSASHAPPRVSRGYESPNTDLT